MITQMSMNGVIQGNSSLTYEHSADIAELKESVENLIILNKISLLYNIDKISKEEYKRLFGMLTSPDKENELVALEVIENLLKEL